MKWVLRIVAILVALPLLGAVVLLAMGQRSGAGRMQTSVQIQASPERIWPWLEDAGRLKQWVSWLVDVRQANSAPGPGVERVWVMRDENNGGELIEIHSVWTAYAPPERAGSATARYSLFPWPGTSRWSFNPGAKLFGGHGV